MSIFLGIDVGTVSLKIALLSDKNSKKTLLNAGRHSDLFFQSFDQKSECEKKFSNLLVTQYSRLRGNPITATYQLLKQIMRVVPREEIAGARVCGSGGRLIGKIMGINYENEFRAIARAVGEFYPGFLTVFEMGGENSKYLALEKEGETDIVGISDYEKSGDCAAGTGSFLDQQASRLKYDISHIGHVVSQTNRSAKIAGRCSVFAKSDMIHAQQKGYTPPEVLRGLCEAVARNFKSSILKGKKVTNPIIMIGGVAKNAGVVNAMREVLKFSPNELFVPNYYAWIPAIGTAIAERDSSQHAEIPDAEKLKSHEDTNIESFPTCELLSREKVLLLRDRVKPRVLNDESEIIDTYIGADVGSVSTNVVLIDNEGNVLKEIYTQTDGRPIEVVDRCLKEINREFGARIKVKGVGATGSGRELIGKLIGADTINDEITAHKTGAEFLAKTMLNTQPDTIFEIGGQDSKYISIENGVVVDFAMNEACAAGTGSFLEERADELGISIKGEFADLALSSKAPIRLGERCTVFMQQDVAAYQQRGASKQDITAGLAYSIVYNYLNRVVQGRKIGDVIFFQGGTAYNNAIASAFAKVLDKEIIVPPYNGVVGAIGAALLAREKMEITETASKFRSFSLDQIDYQLKEFTCKACSNYCHMQEFTVEGEKTYWGDQCSDKFRSRQATEKKPVIDDLIDFRKKRLFEEYDPEVKGKATIGLPRGMYLHEHFSFWNTFFRELGYRVLLSDETNARIINAGIEASVAQPCLPIQTYHGHVQNLLGKDVDWLFVPNMISAETPFREVNSYYCPWGQTLPFVLKNSTVFAGVKEELISPTLRFRDGKEAISKSLIDALKPLREKKKSILRAIDAAYSELSDFQHAIFRAGQAALQTLSTTNEIGIVLAGRNYNIHDKGLTLDIGSKLRDYYGVNIIPMDFLPLNDVNISDINNNLYWNYGRKIIAAAKIVGQYPNLHIIYMTNFKCGPDSYIKHYVSKASGKPFLTLQFDGHGNDAGYITRCEAYLDSKGALRWWNREKKGTEAKTAAVAQ